MPSILDLAPGAGVPLNVRLASTSGERGPEYQGKCPGCGGTDRPGDPSDRFHVWPDQHPERGGSFWCRRCGAAGDGIEFLQKFAGLSFPEAAAAVGMELNKNRPGWQPARRRPWKTTPVLLPPAPPRPGADFTPRQCDNPVETWQDQARKHVDQGAAALMSNPAALAKLERERGITPATAAFFRPGLMLPQKGGRLNCRFSSRGRWGLPPKEKANKPDLLWLPRGLIIPAFQDYPAVLNQGSATAANGNQAIFDETAAPAPAAEIIRLRIRRPDADLDHGGSKYFIIPGSGTAPLFLLDRQPAIVVVESELDAILLYQEVGDLCGVLAMGNSSARPDLAAADRLKKTPLILLAFDADAAGQEAAARWRQWYENSVVLHLPEGIKDPGEFYKAGLGLRDWITAALPSPWRVPPVKLPNVHERLRAPPAPAPPPLPPPPNSSIGWVVID